MNDPLISQFDAFVRRDPAQRGLIGSEPQFGPLCHGHLAGAAGDLASRGKQAVLVTGFYIPRGDPPAAETDGPPGTLLLARVLEELGIATSVVTDGYCWNAVHAAATAIDYPPEKLVRYPHPRQTADDPSASAIVWRREFLSRCAELTHLISIERVGPSHTVESLSRQAECSAQTMQRFVERVATGQRDCCHNMRGEAIDAYAGDVHRLFEDVGTVHPAVKTIGIGDGANEIGMGTVPWQELERRLTGEQSGRVPCRVPCDWNIVAGTSNWGAAALAAAVAHLKGRPDVLAPFTAANQQRVLQEMVAHGPAVDGVTRRREPTVDGLPFLTYIQPWSGMRRLLGLPDSPGD